MADLVGEFQRPFPAADGIGLLYLLVSRITGSSSVSLSHIGRLLLSVGLGRVGKICVAHRIAENKKKHYLSKKLLDLRTQILPSRPSPTDGSRRPMWLGEIEDNPVIRETLAEKLEAALREIEQANAVCSREWALKFTDKQLSRWEDSAQHPSCHPAQHSTRQQNCLQTPQDCESALEIYSAPRMLSSKFSNANILRARNDPELSSWLSDVLTWPPQSASCTIAETTFAVEK
ncbi:hypothetical protein PGTUg99_031286 [Puccinia graminis f. sp. tritici]|uniref:Uncharacterized protein n=1 Tax=Puccinia graminis f. sp. tritici TaxID=56615 RepID=A0A5B0RW34_PUCGR|nr:hypothetical protein PGTUg99_031286 [Puccinia graminis f. sp. tritici]